MRQFSSGGAWLRPQDSVYSLLLQSTLGETLTGAETLQPCIPGGAAASNDDVAFTGIRQPEAPPSTVSVGLDSEPEDGLELHANTTKVPPNANAPHDPKVVIVPPTSD